MIKTTSTSFRSIWLGILVLLLTNLAMAQGRTISGKVTDPKTGSGLADVSVLVKGSTIGTTTGTDGAYSLSVPQNATTLTFSAVGFGEQEVRLSGSGTINVNLQSSVGSMDEVVVVGYGTQTRREVTSAVSSVKAEDMRQSGARNALDLVQGKVAGLQIRRSSSNPNSGVGIQLRGVTSLTAGITPLIVIDGIPGGNLDLLQQE